ncbi:hypothetical protein J6590_078331 [Homalodisca vitripennis]|nr:hypothetical protein J6590_078331 [Homalodisca vitripennis]
MKSYLAAEKNKTLEGIVFVYAKNYSVPNVTTNDVYYKRQLSVFLFNIRVLSTSQSVYYVYSESVGYKGSDENKNNYVVKFLHHLVIKEHKLNSSFPVRGHSYNECDKNSGLIPQKTSDQSFLRIGLTPFEVIQVDQEMINEWTTHLDSLYHKKLGCLTRPIKTFRVQINKPGVMCYKLKYGEPWRENPMLSPTKAKKKTYVLNQKQAELQKGIFVLPGPAYEGK